MGLKVRVPWLVKAAPTRGMTMVTRNTGDLQRCGAMTLNPWA